MRRHVSFGKKEAHTRNDYSFWQISAPSYGYPTYNGTDNFSERPRYLSCCWRLSNSEECCSI